MWFVMFSLVLLYVFFVLALLTIGVDVYIVGIIAVVMALVQYFGSEKLVLRSMGAKEVTPEEEPKLHAVVDRLVALAEMPKPRLAVAHTDIPNAFAAGRNPEKSVICVTTGIMNRLNDEELEAVLAHELAHIKNRDVRVMTLVSFFATVAAMLMQMLMWVSLLGGMGGHRGGRGGGGSFFAAMMVAYLLSIVVYFLATLLILSLSRYREYSADRGGALLIGSPSKLASALMKITGTIARIPTEDLRKVETANAFFIVSALRGESLAGLLASHPPVDKRVARLRRLEQEMEGR
jgi:heat shock protein HtpX